MNCNYPASSIQNSTVTYIAWRGAWSLFATLLRKSEKDSTTKVDENMPFNMVYCKKIQRRYTRNVASEIKLIQLIDITYSLKSTNQMMIDLYLVHNHKSLQLVQPSSLYTEVSH